MAFSGSRLAAARLAAGLTQERLASLLHTKQRRISDWERGMIVPRPDFVPKLAAAIGIDALDLLAVDPAAPLLEDMRMAAGLTMEQVAGTLGISRSQYRAMEIGATRRDPPTGVVEQLAVLFAVPVVAVRQAIAGARL